MFFYNLVCLFSVPYGMLDKTKSPETLDFTSTSALLLAGKLSCQKIVDF
jgi:hypothetical protein